MGWWYYTEWNVMVNEFIRATQKKLRNVLTDADLLRVKESVESELSSSIDAVDLFPEGVVDHAINNLSVPRLADVILLFCGTPAIKRWKENLTGDQRILFFGNPSNETNPGFSGEAASMNSKKMENSVPKLERDELDKVAQAERNVVARSKDPDYDLGKRVEGKVTIGSDYLNQRYGNKAWKELPYGDRRPKIIRAALILQVLRDWNLVRGVRGGTPVKPDPESTLAPAYRLQAELSSRFGLPQQAFPKVHPPFIGNTKGVFVLAVQEPDSEGS
jgi:hypothetical protein